MTCAIVFLILFAFSPLEVLGTFAPTCVKGDWLLSFDRKGWSTCPSSNPLIIGLERSRASSHKYDYIFHIEAARCCSASPSGEYNCLLKDWASTIIRRNTWNLCPSGYFLSGLYRQDGQLLTSIVKAKCCKPKNLPASYKTCYDEDVTHNFNHNDQGLRKCQKDGFFMTGFFKSVCNFVYCIEKFKCCSLAEPKQEPSGRNHVILLTSGFPKGRIGEVKLKRSSPQVEYSLSGGQSGLVEVDKKTGKLTLLSDLPNTNKVKEIDYIVKAGAATGKIFIRVLPPFYGDTNANIIIKRLNSIFQSKYISNEITIGRSQAIDPLKLFKILRYLPDDDPTKQVSLDQLKIEKTLEWTKEKIKEEFEKMFGTDTVVNAFFHVDKLLSANVLKVFDNLLQKHKPPVNIQCDPSSRFRTFDGTCNNLNNTSWGSAKTQFCRILRALYFDADGLNDPIGFPDQPNAPDVPPPFVVSRDFIKVETTSLLSTRTTHAVMQFGQFLDHDIDLTDDSDGGEEFCKESCNLPPSLAFQAPCYPILPISNGEPRCINFVRSAGSFEEYRYPGTRQQINLITSFVDGSQIYGSDKKTADSLREKENDQGLLRVSCGNLLPERDIPIDGNIPCIRGCFQAGDVRSNEQVSLNSFQTLFLREHNRVAKILDNLNDHWDGERVFQEARKIIGAVLQKIVYYNYLPVILGPGVIPIYKAYNENVNPSICNSFATAAYRFGHSAIRTEFDLLNKHFNHITPSSVNLRFMFFNNTLIKDKGIEPILFGLVGNGSAVVDRKLASALINDLFERPKLPGLNLAALNIQRSRDHGLPGYNEFRKLCGLSDAKSFADTANEIRSVENRRILSQLYNDDPNLADLWVAGLAETPLPGASMGPTFTRLIAKQFERTRDGDRFFFEKPGVFTAEQLTEIKRTSLSRIFCDNLKGIVSMQPNAFIRETAISCERIPGINPCFWKENFKCAGTPRFDKKTNKCSCGVENVALGKLTDQSSTDFGGLSSRAVDGKPDTSYGAGSCTHTNFQKLPWWRVDLGKEYEVLYLKITNRGDCCSARLSGFEIRIGNSLVNDGNNNDKCGDEYSLGSAETKKIVCPSPMKGRYVNIIIQRKTQYLTLCEVQVFAPLRIDETNLKNVALSKITVQSSTGFGGLSKRAVDGNTNTNYGGGSCTHTTKIKSPWWRVDLGKEYNVFHLMITNRGDCCSQRLTEFEIRIGNSVLVNNGNNNAKCGGTYSLQNAETRKIVCPLPMMGRYVNIIMPGWTEYLTLCEVQVFGLDLKPIPVYFSCSDALQKISNAKNGWYYIGDSSNGGTKTYCQMKPLTGCSGGGWTLVMKIDGRKETFKYPSSYWNNKQSYNPAGGLSGLDYQETKLPTYWSTSFGELCVGINVANNIKFTSIKFQASSLYDLIADGKYRRTYLGRQRWKSLISGSSLQRRCNKEGFNVGRDNNPVPFARVRIGIIGNQENNCLSPDSYLGFGGPAASERNYCGTQNVINTCGNSATCNPDNGIKEIKGMGYIFGR